MISLARTYWHPNPAIRSERFRAACWATAALLRDGHTVFSPVVFGHSLASFDIRGGWEFLGPHDSEHLQHASVLIVLTLNGWQESVGVQAEI